MNSEAPIKHLIDQLKHHFQAEMVVHQFSIAISLDKLRRELTLSTTVYQGQNYIPLSVRHAVSGHGLGPASAMKGVLSIDDENFAVHLTYCGVVADLSEGMLAYLLEEFSWLAEQWRWILDEQDRRDLVHVPTK